MIGRHRLPLNLSIYKLEDRMWCLTCGSGARIYGVEPWRDAVTLGSLLYWRGNVEQTRAA